MNTNTKINTCWSNTQHLELNTTPKNECQDVKLCWTQWEKTHKDGERESEPLRGRTEGEKGGGRGGVVVRKQEAIISFYIDARWPLNEACSPVQLYSSWIMGKLLRVCVCVCVMDSWAMLINTYIHYIDGGPRQPDGLKGNMYVCWMLSHVVQRSGCTRPH